MISVIIPVFNAEKYISETISSVISQTYADWELIIVNDGSTDNTFKILQEYCQKDSRIKVIDKKNEGVSAARNTGYINSKGDYLAFLDADDKWHKDNLFQKLTLLQTNKEIGLVHADMQFIDENSEIKHECYSGKDGNILKSLLMWDGTNIPSPSSILIRKEVIEVVGMFDTELSTAADQEFFFRVASKYKVARIQRVLGFYRFHSSNMHKNIALMERDHHLAFIKAKTNKLFYSYWFQRRCFSNLFLIIGASWWATDKKRSVKWVLKAFSSYPLNVFVAFRKIASKIINYFSKDYFFSQAKYLVFVFLKLLGFLSFLRFLKTKKDITVLLFHRVSDDPSLSWNPLSPALFEKILQYIKKHYHVISLSDALKPNISKKPKLVLTFDDGYKDFYLNALPLLKKYDLPAVVNLVTDTISSKIPIWSQRINDLIDIYVDSGYQLTFSIDHMKYNYNIHKDNVFKISTKLFNLFMNLNDSDRNDILSELENNCPKVLIRTEFLNSDEIIEATKSKIVFGNHSASHCNFNNLITKEEFDYELVRSNEIIEKITGFKNDIFSFPNGIFNDNSLKILENYGFRKLLIVGESIFRPDLREETFIIPRKSLYYKSLIENQFKIEGFHTLIKKVIN